LGWQFIDADEWIEAKSGRSVAEIFARHGEPFFRALEESTIAQLAGQEALVLALGGGAIESEATRALLTTTPGTLLIHLHVELVTALARCQGTENARPVLADRANLASRYERRLLLYRSARISIPVDALTPEQAVEAVVRATKR